MWAAESPTGKGKVDKLTRTHTAWNSRPYLCLVWTIVCIVTWPKPSGVGDKDEHIVNKQLSLSKSPRKPHY